LPNLLLCYSKKQYQQYPSYANYYTDSQDPHPTPPSTAEPSHHSQFVVLFRGRLGFSSFKLGMMRWLGGTWRSWMRILGIQPLMNSPKHSLQYPIPFQPLSSPIPPRNSINNMIQFFQIGNDEMARRYLEELDEDLGSRCNNLHMRDIAS
jgi:hypothetical protein